MSESGDAAIAALTAAGDEWRNYLPEGAVIAADGQRAVWDTVQLTDGTQVYRAEREGQAPYWVEVGWSDASKARRFRYQPSPEDLHDVPDAD